MEVGILAIQGGYEAHKKAIEACNAKVRLVRLPEDLTKIDALVFPGGESTTHIYFIEKYNLREPLIEFFKSKKPILATCAGAILISKTIIRNEGDKHRQMSLSFIDISLQRNAYGSQVQSFEAPITLCPDSKILESTKPFPGIFIRAPIILFLGPTVKILGTFNKQPVIVKDGHILAMTFHPELTSDLRIHKYFLQLKKNN